MTAFDMFLFLCLRYHVRIYHTKEDVFSVMFYDKNKKHKYIFGASGYDLENLIVSAYSTAVDCTDPAFLDYFSILRRLRSMSGKKIKG